MIFKTSHLTFLLILVAVVGIAKESSRLLWLTQAQSVAISPVQANVAVASLDNLRFASGNTISSLPVQTSNWKVQGIYFEENNESVALIETADGIFNIEEGDAINQVSVIDITETTVTIDNAGKIETLSLPYSELMSVVDNIGGVEEIDITTAQLATISNDPRQLLTQIRFTNIHHMGLPAIEVSNQNGDNFLAVFGLQDNDAILEVNNSTVSSEILMDLLLNAEKNKKISAKIKRHDKILEFIYNFR